MQYPALSGAISSSGVSVSESVSVTAKVGERVRQHRASRGWTLSELAERSGVSRRMLISVEHGTSNASIATLLRISDALGVGLPALVDVQRPSRFAITRNGCAPLLWRGTHGGSAHMVAGTEPPDVVELWDWVLQPGEQHVSEAHSAGTRELLLVLAGQVELRVGEQTERLNAGDSATFAGDLDHAYAAPDDAQMPSRFALTVFQPHVQVARR
jgi:quercetin dioxygenase-like cupin family protein/DNA-binding XRE family transcriptional regulator